MPDVLEELAADEKVLNHFRSKIDNLPVNEFDQMSASLYLRFGKYLSRSKFSRVVYSNLFDYWFERRFDDIPRSLIKRMDVRSMGLFSLKIHDNHVRESAIMYRWMSDNRHKHGLEGKHLGYTGIAGNGRVVFESAHDDFKKTDFFTDGIPVELKNVPCLFKATYKRDDLIAYVRQKAMMLTLFFKNIKAEQIELDVLHDYRSDWPRHVRFYTLMEPSDMIRLMSEVQLKNWEEVEHKPSYQITDEFTPLYGRGRLLSYGKKYEWGN